MNARLVLSVLALSLLLTACENDIEKVKYYGKKEYDAVESARNIKMIYSDSAQIKTVLTAPLLLRFEGKEPYIEMPDGLKAVFYTADMKIKNQLTAEYGIRYQRQLKMEARKNVVVINEKGEKLTTEHLIWDEKNQKLISDENVVITTGDKEIHGRGMEANQDFSQWKIFNPTGTFNIKESNAQNP